MELSTLTDIELLSLLKEQTDLFKQIENNITLINAELNKRIEQHNKNKNP